MPAEKIQPDSAHRVEGRKGSARSAAGQCQLRTRHRCGQVGVLGGTEGTSTQFYEKGVINVSPRSPLSE